MNYTKNYQLNQWEPADRVLRTDFNEDNRKIDAALHTMQGALPELVLGTYTGDGSAVRTVDLGFTPQAIYVTAMDGSAFRYRSGGSEFTGGFALNGHPCYDFLKHRLVLSICENGFQVGHSTETGVYVLTNTKDEEYRYIALK